MKVLLAHKFYSVTGGAEVFYLEVGRVLRENGHEVMFFSTGAGESAVYDDSVIIVDAPKYKGSLLDKVKAIPETIYSRRKGEEFAAVLDEFQPDIIHVFAIHVHLTPSILKVAYDRKVPVVMSCNDYKHICPNYKLFNGEELCERCKGGKFFNSAIKKCSHGSFSMSIVSAVEAYVHEYLNVYDQWVSVYLFASSFMLDKTKEFWPNKHIAARILRNPFDYSQYVESAQGQYVLYFGRIIQEKGVDRLVSEVAGSDIPVKIVGDGPDLDDLKASVVALGAHNVDIVGPVWGDEILDILNAARLVVVPSIWHENFPYVVLQAFASGKPVLASARGGLPELVHHSRGRLFDPDVPGDLMVSLNEMWSSPDLCTELGSNARKYVEREFNDSVFYGEVMASYELALA